MARLFVVLMAGALAVITTAAASVTPRPPPPCCDQHRPPPDKRLFSSSAVEAVIASFGPRFLDNNISRLFENGFPNCLDTTVTVAAGKDRTDSFVITGDIHAMWLRDSTNQVLPYVAFAASDPPLQDLLCGVIRRQARMVGVNRYANAFNYDLSGNGHNDDALTLKPAVTYCARGQVFENKYELDSLVNVLKLANSYYNATNDASCFKDDDWLPAIEIILDTITVQQAGTDEDFDDPAYTFSRQTTVATDTLLNGNRGSPARRTGMSKSYFRASDDANTFPFSVPANAYATVELARLTRLLDIMGQTALSARASALSGQIKAGIDSFGVIEKDGKRFFAYEVDGFGSAYFMDDANIPSLLALPYLGFVSKSDPTYLETRKRVLSNATNPYFFQGKAAEGVGGPHVGTNFIWPMSIIMRALTSDDDAEIAQCLAILARTHADKYFMHESFHKDNSMDYTRTWFSWANSLFADLILTLARERPHLIFK